MENASKALLMAAGVLLGIILISFAVYTFRSVASLSEEYDENQERTQIASYNNKFEKYNRDDLTVHDIISVLNLAMEGEEEYGIVPVFIGTTNLVELFEKEHLDQSTYIIINREKTYKCTNIEYKDGKVNYIKFIENTT